MNDLVERTVDLCRALRERGLGVTTSHATDSVRALSAVGIEEREQVRLALRCVLASRPEEFAIVDTLFDQLFGRERERRPQAARRKPQAGDEPAAPSLSAWSGGAASDEEPEAIKGASEHRGSVEKDFRSFGSDELGEIERIARRIARKLAARPSRRWKAARTGARVDLRRTMRRAPSGGGELIDLRFRRRKTRKTRIVALCDVSGSMDLYSRLLLQFLYALQGSTARVESFVFSTELRRVTEALRGRDYAEALRELAFEVHDWSGGTRIGECLSSFNEGWGNLVDRRTVVVILSDGWDTGDPALLAEQLESLRVRSRRLVWLNPLLGSPGYEPLTVGMQAALPHLGVFAPAHNLDSLRQLGRYLQ
ncbi:MAG: VWA domain-containing protein [Myxococcales bacterium]